MFPEKNHASRVPSCDEKTPALARRQFVFDSARLLCGVGVLGLCLAGYARKALAKPPMAIRPPG
ncbi:MAG TPA: hypothetical protein PLT46_10345, partial [Burkholderiaceae bacterium]|nr:hypothetical protein [Burkholderiaceae bacterium]